MSSARVSLRHHGLWFDKVRQDIGFVICRNSFSPHYQPPRTADYNLYMKDVLDGSTSGILMTFVGVDSRRSAVGRRWHPALSQLPQFRIPRQISVLHVPKEYNPTKNTEEFLLPAYLPAV